MRWKSHVRFGRRAAETDRSKDRHRAAARPHTEHPTAEGKLYLCAVKDTCSGRIVGYAIDSRMSATPSTRG
jgi:transposase InsO family protein